MTKSNLFQDFDPVSAKAFKQKIQFDLKGASYNDTLIWHTNEGIDVKPFYHGDDIDESQLTTPQTPEQWYISEAIFILDPAQSAVTANTAIEAGAEAIYFTANEPFDIEVLYNHLSEREIPLYFNLRFLDEDFCVRFYAFAKAYKNTTLKLDLIHHLIEDGNWFHSMERDHKILNTILNSEGQKNITIDTTFYQNAGATMVQQLAYGISHLNEYLNHIEQQKIECPHITFEVAVGTNYFFEIAKLRALRQLTAILLSEYGFSESTRVHIIAHPTRRNKTIYDYNTNMLRTTTECMSAILGGANVVVNQPYDAIYHKTNNFGQRISRNQLIILKEESYFDAVSNPADGAYYIESITSQLAQKSLDLFKEIEQKGGFLKQLKEGTIQRKIKESDAREQEQFNNKELILLGTNKHPNLTDKMKDELELFPFVKRNPRKTIITPIIPRRLSEIIEQERLKNEV
ncbi:methylmalonyl-CoA mutase [Dokdonia sinensis]|uniref:Methylmalonyl-CoA mutase n=1 Tax=Dokdonia sinensis TaxID=2479847 RepID=A0A3M0GI26_9FLAO|nr:methylmalonyl-CoA mutase subunit beta [Dokdonia sinensis]RMB63928.1 methylmalonyl-CoA mutase [Dokdonia sinensis]